MIDINKFVIVTATRHGAGPPALQLASGKPAARRASLGAWAWPLRCTANAPRVAP